MSANHPSAPAYHPSAPISDQSASVYRTTAIVYHALAAAYQALAAVYHSPPRAFPKEEWRHTANLPLSRRSEGERLANGE